MSDSIGFLLSDVSRLARRRFDERARLHGATRAQWKALLMVSRHEGINQGGLADLLEVEPITLCRMVDRLEDAGLVERRRDPGDRRAWQIFLTDAAQPVLASLRTEADALTEVLLSGIDDATRARFVAVLDMMRTNLITPEPSKEAAHG